MNSFTLGNLAVISTHLIWCIKPHLAQSFIVGQIDRRIVEDEDEIINLKNPINNTPTQKLTFPLTL